MTPRLRQALKDVGEALTLAMRSKKEKRVVHEGARSYFAPLRSREPFDVLRSRLAGHLKMNEGAQPAEIAGAVARLVIERDGLLARVAELEDEPFRLTGKAAEQFVAEMNRVETPEERTRREDYLAHCEDVHRKTRTKMPGTPEHRIAELENELELRTETIIQLERDLADAKAALVTVAKDATLELLATLPIPAHGGGIDHTARSYTAIMDSHLMWNTIEKRWERKP